ncbi:leucyl aminopeptidase [Cryobacterium sp. LW097]|uniref:leucyl aminopeptidase n=1 Tax=unclassified Cryobacterium TaxID=2649013 RepID=UPI000B4C5848|nr:MULTISPECIES: leucyl aminopeptidase [unclassified Cryobacterium]ASD22099.1 leucyl aminopeptidase [Cryobacterium sp. LW097]TFC55742.1 leucyl aminopeptidase [Cryobacterium sp. TMB3-1-2]TFC57072.1 leucyl aminopeptidase [Cryobacterium sp. TMB1-7]TFC72702.1 leucyl aminopeptidase [Cryobacterium sp. TMB3-15]TFC76208.1 leucyl aminopeptidase [Cryobacterium sp. TMB3-10]
MTVSRVSVSAQPSIESTADVIVIGAVQGKDGPTLFADPGFEEIAAQFAAVAVSGTKDQLIRLAPVVGAAKTIAVIGLGSVVTPESLRYAAGSAVRQLTGAATVAFALPLADADQAAAVLEGAALGGYSFTTYRKASLAATKLPATDITVHTDQADEDASDRAGIVADAVSLVKDLVNMPPLDLYPESLADLAAAAAEGLPVTLTVWDEDQLVADGFGGIAGVGQGSTRPPRLVKVSYDPIEATQHLALVGKGITFDTGGLSLKPPASMVGMKYDMTGAATVLAVTLAAARLRLPVRLTAWLCIAENMPSGSAIRPNDVLTMRGGRTVEVLNTDAEGRLVLADGLVAAGEERPDAIIDVATLTGAAIVALGTRYSAVLGNDDLVAQVLAASKAEGELAWPMPMPEELRALLNSDVADIANAKIGNTGGGMLLAAVFLNEFIGSTGEGAETTTIPWAHLDIAGSAQLVGGGLGFTAPGPTGVTVRTLLRLAEEFSRK